MNLPGRALSFVSLLLLTHCSGVFDIGSREASSNGPSTTVVLSANGEHCPSHFATSVNEPKSDATACEEFAFGASRELLRHTIRRSETEATAKGLAIVKYIDVFDEAVTLRSRTTERFEGVLLDSTSTESFWLPSIASLPGTDGLPATWKTTFAYDSSGRRISARFDRAIDGTLEAEHTWTYYPNGQVREHFRRGNEAAIVEISDSAPWLLEAFNEVGQLVSRLDDTSTGERHTYGAGGLRLVSEQLKLGAVVSRDEWTMADNARALLHKRFDLLAIAGTKLVLEEQFDYHSDKTLKFHTIWELANDVVHTIRYDYDAAGRELLMVEIAPSSHCTRASTYDGRGNALSVRTECAEGEFDETAYVWNDANQLVSTNRHWTVDHTERTATVNNTYNACGGLSETVSKVDGKLTGKRLLTYDQYGSIKTDTNGALSKPITMHYDYDGQGRLIVRNSDRWVFNEAGKLSEHDLGVPQVVEPGLAPIAHISYRYQCEEPR